MLVALSPQNTRDHIYINKQLDILKEINNFICINLIIHIMNYFYNKFLTAAFADFFFFPNNFILSIFKAKY